MMNTEQANQDITDLRRRIEEMDQRRDIPVSLADLLHLMLNHIRDSEGRLFRIEHGTGS